MKIDVNRLKPGMVLVEDVVGKSGKPIMKKETVLTEVEITFLRKFMIPSVHVSTPRQEHLTKLAQKEAAGKVEQIQKSMDDLTKSASYEAMANEIELSPKEKTFYNLFTQNVHDYRRMFQTWQSNLPINMYEIRTICIPMFEKVLEQPFNTVLQLLNGNEKELFYYKNVAVSMLSVYLANKLNYERKEWLQIGFAAYLSDSGLAKYRPAVKPQEIDQRHPAISYDMVKNEPTLTKAAKFAVLQHHEYLDGTGYPLKLNAERIHPYAKIITIADVYYTQIILGLRKQKDLQQYLTVNMAKKLDQAIVQVLLQGFNEENDHA